MRRLSLLFALVAAAFPMPAAATDWFLTAQSQNGLSVSFVDKDSIRPAGEGVRRANVYVVFRQADNEGMASLDALMEFDCQAMRRRYVRITGYDERLAAIRTEEGSMRWTEVIPGSQDAVGREFICSGGAAVPGATSHGSAYPFAAARARMSARQ